MKQVFTTGQVAKICRVSPATIAKWFDSGRLPGYRIPGSQDRRILRQDLIAFLRANCMPLGDLAIECGSAEDEQHSEFQTSAPLEPSEPAVQSQIVSYRVQLASTPKRVSDPEFFDDDLLPCGERGRVTISRILEDPAVVPSLEQRTAGLTGKHVFSTGEVALLCRVAPRTVVKWIDSGRLKAFKTPNSHRRHVPRESLSAFLQEHGFEETLRILEGRSAK